MDYIRLVKGGQEQIFCADELLQDKRFSWRIRKMKTRRLGDLYEMAGMDDYARRAWSCATHLEYGAAPNGEKRLTMGNFCQLRLCPLCIARRAKKAAYRLSRVLDLVEQRHGYKYIFLTLTAQNVDGEHLGESLQQLTKGWDRLLKQRPVKRAVKGYFRSIEITRGDGKKKADHGYNQHLHAILAVEPGYFWRGSDQYITQAEWVRRWQQALQVNYKTVLDIRATYGKKAKKASRSAAAEANKYAVKDKDYIDPSLSDERAVEILVDYTAALHRRRLTAMGGCFADAARELDIPVDLEDDDLVHLDDEEALRDDVLELIEVYQWNFGVGDYILASRRINPLWLERQRQKQQES